MTVSGAWRARVGLVLQSTSLDPEPTVRDTVSLYAPPYTHPYKVDEVLELVDPTADADTRLEALSGGQPRRVDLAIGLIGRPDILFLDEPTTGLDPEARRRTWTAVENLTSTGTTFVLTGRDVPWPPDTTSSPSPTAPRGPVGVHHLGSHFGEPITSTSFPRT